MEIEERIIEEIEKLKPFLQSDGGNIEYVKYEDGKVYVRLTGACAGCSMIDVTLKDGIDYIRNHNNCSVVFTIKLKGYSYHIPIGQIGFYYADPSCKEIGIFYYIGENYQKKGYAAEAARPLIKHLFENLPLTTTLKIDFCDKNIASKKLALLICNDIMKDHPNYIFGELTPFIDKYTIINEPPLNGKVKYYFDGFDRKQYVMYQNYYFNNVKYFEVRSEGYYIIKQ